MVWLPAGDFTMGSVDFYPEEAPLRRVAVDGFWMDEHPVTVAEVRRFIKSTGHVPTAEQAPSAVDYPDADPELLVAGSLVFAVSSGPVDLRTFTIGRRGDPAPSGAGLRGRTPASGAGSDIPWCM